MKELGELIRAARSQKGITLERAAVETRIRREYLGAIEDGDFRIFPGSAYATGFLRNYAAYLGLNPDEILQTYHAIAPPTVISIEPATTVGIERLRRRSRRRLSWLFAAIVMVFLVAVLFHKYNTPARGAAVAPRLPVSTSGLTSPSRPLLRNHSPQHRHLLQRTPSRLSRRKEAAVGLHALKPTWVLVKVNKRRVFWGRIATGHYRRWTGRTITVRSLHGNSIRTWTDGRLIGRLGNGTGRSTLTTWPHGWHRFR